MYYHGWVDERGQRPKVAVSQDGIAFTALPESLRNAYFRVYLWDGHHCALGMPGKFYRSEV